MEPKPCRRVTNVVEEVADCERQGGPGDHRVLLRGDNSAPLNMPDGFWSCSYFPAAELKICGAGSGICIGCRQDKPNWVPARMGRFHRWHLHRSFERKRSRYEMPEGFMPPGAINWNDSNNGARIGRAR